jgi:dolichyl-diphosphooligosaccharide--protein glycosyltransferase
LLFNVGVFGLVQIMAFAEMLKSHLTAKEFKHFLLGLIVTIGGLGFIALVGLTKAGVIAPFTGRFYSLWDTAYAKIHIPIIASVSEHQPTTWTSFFFDLQILIAVFPAGVYLCFRELKDEHVFVVIFKLIRLYTHFLLRILPVSWFDCC